MFDRKKKIADVSHFFLSSRMVKIKLFNLWLKIEFWQHSTVRRWSWNPLAIWERKKAQHKSVPINIIITTRFPILAHEKLIAKCIADHLSHLIKINLLAIARRLMIPPRVICGGMEIEDNENEHSKRCWSWKKWMILTCLCTQGIHWRETCLKFIRKSGQQTMIMLTLNGAPDFFSRSLLFSIQVLRVLQTTPLFFHHSFFSASS